MRRVIGVTLACGLCAAAMVGQQPFGELLKRPSETPKAAVTFEYPEQVTVTAGRSAEVELHFRVADGLHINAHLPTGEGMIATVVEWPQIEAVKLAHAEYPAGHEFALALAPKEKFSVYTGEFVVKADVVAAKGEHLVEAKLRYQACDTSACMPPHTIPVVVDVVGR